MQAPPLEFDSDQLVGTHVWAVFLGRELLLQRQKKISRQQSLLTFLPLTLEPSILSHVEQRVELLNSCTEIYFERGGKKKLNGQTENNTLTQH